MLEIIRKQKQQMITNLIISKQLQNNMNAATKSQMLIINVAIQESFCQLWSLRESKTPTCCNSNDAKEKCPNCCQHSLYNSTDKFQMLVNKSGF